MGWVYGRVCGILRCAKLPQDNHTKEQRKPLKELRRIDELVLPADKGNATILMTREEDERTDRDYHLTTAGERPDCHPGEEYKL